MLLEIFGGVHEALKLDHAADAVEVAESELHDGQNVEPGRPRKVVPLACRELAAELALRSLCPRRGRRPLAGNEEQAVRLDAVRIVSRRVARRRKSDLEL